MTTPNASPPGENARPFASPVGNVTAGFAYLVPKPVVEFHGYAETYGADECCKATASPAGVNFTFPVAKPVGSVAGLAYLVPKPVVEFHG